MNFPLLIALSHLRSNRNARGVSVITMISMLGFTVGVTALIMVLAVMEGFELDLRDKILGSNAHVIVVNYNGSFGEYQKSIEMIEETEGVLAATPFVYSEMMIRSAKGASGIIFKGIDTESVTQVTDIGANLIMGPKGPVLSTKAKQEVVDKLHRPERGLFQLSTDTKELPGIILGQELSQQLWVNVGDVVHIINPVSSGVGIMGTPIPDIKEFRIAGIFNSGMYEYDTKWTYVTKEDAQQYLKIGDEVNGIEIKLHDIDAAGIKAIELQAKLGSPYTVRHWKEVNRNLFAALKLEKIVMGLILSLIVMVASINIIGMLILVVMTRRREIAILRAMGSSSTQICSIFILEGVIIGIVGTMIGTILGLLGCIGLKRYEFPLDTDVYYLDTLPVVIEPSTVILVAISAICISFVATIYPAVVAANMEPVDGLRYD